MLHPLFFFRPDRQKRLPQKRVLITHPWVQSLLDHGQAFGEQSLIGQAGGLHDNILYRLLFLEAVPNLGLEA